MRIIAGTAKGRRLRAPATTGTRPLADRVKEGIFSSLGDRVADATVLDLYAGSGSFGLEALSRGASQVEFVEKGRQALTALRSNVSSVGLGGEVIASDVHRYLKNCDHNFDIVFLDAPWDLALNGVLVAAAAKVAPAGLLVLSRRQTDQTPSPPHDLVLAAERRYGDTKIIWYSKEAM